jgi:hypothetical protein
LASQKGHKEVVGALTLAIALRAMADAGTPGVAALCSIRTDFDAIAAASISKAADQMGDFRAFEFAPRCRVSATGWFSSNEQILSALDALDAAAAVRENTDEGAKAEL